MSFAHGSVALYASGGRSRERNARREARVALTHLAVNLGPPYFTYLVTELVRMLGPKNEKDEAANQKGFLRPVLIFTLHAMLNSLLQQRSSSPEAPLLRTAEEAATIDGTHFIQRFEAVVPLLLPLIAEVSRKRLQRGSSNGSSAAAS